METVTVTQLNTRVHEMLSASSGTKDIWVTGEISNLKKAPSGHYYFTLKDENSQIAAAMFSFSRMRVDFEPKENMKVAAFGHIDLYVPYGRYQFIVETMRQSGIGDLYLRFAELKSKLEAEGLFDSARKRPIPAYPRTIGVVTSETGAVIHDIITTSASRFPADILLCPAQVQGEGSVDSIINGIKVLNGRGVDVIIVGRGGGSIEDLWSFNDERVARAIAASEVPVVSAVGHETDFTIADFVADARAPTPTGAAALILRDAKDVLSDVANLSHRADVAARRRVSDADSRIRMASARLDPRRASESIAMGSIVLDDLFRRAGDGPRTALVDMRRRFEAIASKMSPARSLDRIASLEAAIYSISSSVSAEARHRLDRACSMHTAVAHRPEKAIKNLLAAKAVAWDSVSKRLEAVNPMNVLGRGYAVVESDDGRILVSASGISEGDRLRVRLRDGVLSAEVRRKEMKE